MPPKIAIVISNSLLAKPGFKDFVVAHEAGHLFLILNKKLDYFLRPWRNARNEIECDRFAAKVIGRAKTISGLETSLGMCLDDALNPSSIEEINMRIMSFYMPTLFRQYAS